MTFKDKITFFYAIEEKLWDENVESNKYFATLCILCVALVGAFNSVGGAIQSMLGADVQPSIYASVALCLFIWGLNVGESILACTNALTALKRSLLMFVALVIACVAGIVLGGIVVAIVCIVLFIFTCYVVIMALLNLKIPGSGEAQELGLFGRKLKGDFYRGSDGREKFRDEEGVEHDVI